MPATEQQIFAVADEFHDIISQKLSGPDGLHPATAIAAASRMAGTYVLRSFHDRIEPAAPATVVLSEQATEKGVALINVLGRTLLHFGVQVEVAHVRPPDGAVERPHLDVLDTQELVERDLGQIQKVYGLTYDEAAHAAVICGAMFIRESVVFVGEGEGFSLAAYSLIEGLKTAPQNVDVFLSPQPKRRWYERW